MNPCACRPDFIGAGESGRIRGAGGAGAGCGGGHGDRDEVFEGAVEGVEDRAEQSEVDPLGCAAEEPVEL